MEEVHVAQWRPLATMLMALRGPSSLATVASQQGLCSVESDIDVLFCLIVKRGLSLQGRTQVKLNSVALVRKRTMPTERPPLVDEVSANFCGLMVSRGQRNGTPRPLISIF
jgi:hypothetical protein